MDSTTTRSPTALLRRAASLALLLALHLGLLAYFVGVEVWFGDRPMAVVDYDTHIAQAWRVLEGLAASGDADTRAKALLGQAQLAFSRGDRAAAKRLTRAAASVPGASAAVREKALRWAARASL